MKKLNFQFQTTNKSVDYSILFHLLGNRFGGGINQVIIAEKQSTDFERKVKELMKSMAKMGFNENFPIECAFIEGYLYILDGQHRAEAAKRLKIPFHYIVKPSITTFKAANEYCEERNNSKRSAWDLCEYIYRVISDVKSYPLEKREKMQKIIDISNKYCVPVAYVCDVAIGSGSTRTTGVLKKNLDFELKNDAEYIFSTAHSIAKKHPKTDKVMSSRAFVRSIARLIRHPYLKGEMIDKALNYDFDFDIKMLRSDNYVCTKIEKAVNKNLSVNKISLTYKECRAK